MFLLIATMIVGLSVVLIKKEDDKLTEFTYLELENNQFESE